MGLRLDVIAHFLQHLGNQVSQSVVPHIGVPSKMTRKEVVNVAWLTTAANSWHVRDCPVVAKGHAVPEFLFIKNIPKFLQGKTG